MKKKVISARLAKRHAFFGKLDKTHGGLTKGDFVKNKSGKIVSKKASLRAKKSPWLAAVKAARAALKIKGFAAIKKGTPTRRPRSSTPSECCNRALSDGERQLWAWGFLRL